MERNCPMDKIRGRRGGGWEPMVQTPRGDALPSLLIRAKKLAAKWDRSLGHGGQFAGDDFRPGIG